MSCCAILPQPQDRCVGAADEDWVAPAEKEEAARFGSRRQMLVQKPRWDESPQAADPAKTVDAAVVAPAEAFAERWERLAHQDRELGALGRVLSVVSAVVAVSVAAEQPQRRQSDWRDP